VIEPARADRMGPVNKALESGAWTQSIIWGPRAPFRDFTQIEFNNDDDIIPEERPGSCIPSTFPPPFQRFSSAGRQTQKAFSLRQYAS